MTVRLGKLSTERGGMFEGDHCAIALEFSADGFSPFHHFTSEPYSIEQQASVILNLPPETSQARFHSSPWTNTRLVANILFIVISTIGSKLASM